MLTMAIFIALCAGGALFMMWVFVAFCREGRRSRVCEVVRIERRPFIVTSLGEEDLKAESLHGSMADVDGFAQAAD
jgi:hypothetical protein